MKSFSLLLFLLLCSSSFAMTVNLSQKKEKPLFRNYTENLSFNYGVQFLGPSLSGDYEDGATYNRFKTGQDWTGQDMDATGSHQYFHAMSIGYNLTNNLKISYSYTFQEDVNKVSYKENNLNGTKYRSQRNTGISDNNKRINLFASNLYQNKYFGINSNFLYEMASTNTSQYVENRTYGLGIEPSIYLKNLPSKFMAGTNISILRNYFKRQQYDTVCTNSFTGQSYTCPIPTRYQTLLMTVNPYLNYILNDYTTLTTSLTFDWDQKGDEVDSTETYNKNMDDVGRIGANFNIDYGMYAGTFIEFGLEQASLNKTAIGLNLNISLY